MSKQSDINGCFFVLGARGLNMGTPNPVNAPMPVRISPLRYRLVVADVVITSERLLHISYSSQN